MIIIKIACACFRHFWDFRTDFLWFFHFWNFPKRLFQPRTCANFCKRLFWPRAQISAAQMCLHAASSILGGKNSPVGKNVLRPLSSIIKTKLSTYIKDTLTRYSYTGLHLKTLLKPKCNNIPKKTEREPHHKMHTFFRAILQGPHVLVSIVCSLGLWIWSAMFF